jgi:uncharacterized protein
MTLEELRRSGLIAYEYIRGSKSYGLDTPTSDEDHGGVFICPPEMLMGLRSNYVEQVADEKGDTVFYEFGRWIELLLKSNPTALESLFIPERCVIGNIHPMVKYIIDHRDMFLSKECFKTLTGYAHSQIYKARGLNKKIVNPITERKGVLDFCYVPWGQGSKKVKDWLYDNGLKQKYCGLVALPNMHDLYGLYYDWGTHLICEYGADLKNKTNLREVWDKLCNEMNENIDAGEYEPCFASTFEVWGLGRGEFLTEYEDFVKHTEPYGFTGIVSETEDSNEVRVCTVPKNLKPLIYMTYNKSGYESHCRDYKDYKEWEQKRNPVRYESNLNKNYDSKNLSHVMRLMRMGKELAQGKGFNVDRTNIDREYLLAIKNHEFEYDDIIAHADKEKKEMEESIITSTLPDNIDYDKVNELLINARKEFYNI